MGTVYTHPCSACTPSRTPCSTEKQGAGRVHASALTLRIPRNTQSLPPNGNRRRAGVARHNRQQSQNTRSMPLPTTAAMHGWHDTRQRSPGTPSSCPQQQLPRRMGGTPRERTIHARSGAPAHVTANPALPRDVGRRQNRQEIHQKKLKENKVNSPSKGLLRRYVVYFSCAYGGDTGGHSAWG
jgi:hypothetical protein